METKKRLSLDGISPGSGPSALRRLTRSPSHRLSLRRSSTESTRSSVVSASVSVLSDDSEASSSACVTRDTARDECALHRFIVWTAVKRNECDKMTSQEKRECPMLRCRKRFPNHELMLQHLYSCEWLAAGEYWCYECEKAERFNDAKCKRCLGHPSRRRKIMSMAKNFFSSLGHKSKNSTLSDLDLDLDDAEAPPSYDSAVAPPEVELYSNEIHEIDSCEIALPTIVEDEAEADMLPAPMPTPDMPPLPIQPLPTRPSHPAELESGANLEEPLIDWNSLPDTVAPVNLIDPGANVGPARPVLQLHTSDLDEYRRQQKKRSKGAVCPSTSVRSTASTNSTSSTNSTLSTASYNISPVSAWSGPWARTTGFESTLTSPADDLASPGGLLRANSFAISRKASTAKDWSTFDNSISESYDSYVPELPADMPMLGALPGTDSVHDPDPLALDQPVFTLDDSSLPTDFSLGSNLALTDNNATMDLSVPTALAEPMVGYYHNPRSLVGTAWDALEMHVVESMAKLQQMTKNHLVSQLRSMTAHSIAMSGLETLIDILEGRQPDAPVKLLCFVHLVYCFSLVVHEQDAASRSTDLFGQAMSYSAWFSRHDRQLYIQVVDALWKPASMTEADVVNLVRAKTSPSMSRSSSLKGKERELAPMHQSNTDSLAFVAQYFLDQLEYATVQVIDQPEIQSSDLYMQHLHDPTMAMHGDSPYAIATNFMLKHNFQLYTNVPAFAASLNDIVQRVNSNSVSTLRRLELELMHAGKMCLPSEFYFDHFIEHVRQQMDSLYRQNLPQGNFRSTYYRHGAKLIEAIINATARPTLGQPVSNNTASGITALDELDEFIEAMTPNPFNFDPTGSFNPEPPVNFPPMPNTIDPYTLNPQPLPTPADTNSVRGPSTANSPPSPAPAASSSSAAKVKSNSCCEICGYRPEGDPRWFSGSMAKHKKLQHATTPPRIYRCPFPGCTSQYKNRPDNLRQHQIEKGHFLEGQDVGRRPNKRRKVD
ncbi:hypothetical protein FDECE_10111 [Fusarium decemcellulare]|nr:hypothetical protein FDECE_10111 [Fusarium decemcellulare]